MGHKGVCLLINSNKSAILAVKHKEPKDCLYYLPEYQLKDSDNAAAILKKELKEDFDLSCQFQRILPDTWSRLVFTQKHKQAFLIYYIFLANEVTSNKKNSSAIKYDWVNFESMQDSVFSSAQSGAIKILLENCGIIID